jgi:hypothetical protein
MSYAVIVCSGCKAGKIVDTSKRTTTCFRCGKHIQLHSREFLYVSETLAQAQDALGIVLARHDGKLEEFKTFMKTTNK